MTDPLPPPPPTEACTHPRLILVLKPGRTVYRCQQCGELLAVTLSPYGIEVKTP